MPGIKSQHKRKAFQSVIAHLFADKGYYATSMRDIARQLGINQGSLYYYFKNKEEILFRLMDDAMDDALQTLERICESDLAPEEKLNRILHFYTRYYAGDQHLLVLLVNEMDSLDRDYRTVLLRKQRRYVKLFESILSELAAQGRMKDIYPGVAAFAFFGMVHYTIKWYHETGHVGLEGLSDIFLEIFTRGILSTPPQ
ncbi:MAG: TetR/AcrR family transcriptional regulator [Desulfatiglandaceae bacterium]|jgi:TetR/AcrR family transcriptional regulator, cholesterol catabolism regulator